MKGKTHPLGLAQVVGEPAEVEAVVERRVGAVCVDDDRETDGDTLKAGGTILQLDGGGSGHGDRSQSKSEDRGEEHGEGGAGSWDEI